MIGENVKKFLETMSNESQEAVAKLKDADAETIISMAKERGITITPEELNQDDTVDELSMDELAATAGGSVCVCAAAGGGVEDQYHKACACVLGGGGEARNGGEKYYNIPCVCVIGGSGGKRDGTYD